MSIARDRILAFEIRRAPEMQVLLAKHGGRADFVSTFSEAPLEANGQACAFGEELLAGFHPMVLCLTGVAVRRLLDLLRTRHPAEALREALAKTFTVSRGPKPSQALREAGITPGLVVGEPSTWREVLAALAGRTEKSLAVIEYGQPDERLLTGLLAQGRAVRRVPVYHYELPADTAPIRATIERLIAGDYTLLVFTSSIQYQNLAQVARLSGREEELKTALNRAAVAAIGPTMAETLREDGVAVAFEPTHPKLGVLVQELAAWRQTGGSPTRT